MDKAQEIVQQIDDFIAKYPAMTQYGMSVFVVYLYNL